MSRQRRPVQGEESDSPATKLANLVLEVPPKLMKKLLHWDELPHWQRDNHHIHTGYRPASSSFWVSFQSLGYFHNETVNIYTHLLPSILAIPASYQLYNALTPRYQTADSSDIAAFICFFSGAAFCLGMSATYHTISNHSPAVARIGNALDYIGIVGLIVGSFVPSVFYGFYSLGWGVWVSQFSHGSEPPRWRPFRAAMFVGMGLSAVFPVVHGLVLFGFERMRQQIGLSWLLLQGFLYILGAAIYAARIPERLRPGQFDLVGSSHQIFHVLVVCAAIAHLTGLLKAFDYRHGGTAEICQIQIPRG
ncbi:uncharacterized protein N7483_001395 [Penicillium malachiteum]|uniref:uncharacterized protein n=1 Tax=Penicillium malachiteum TaxID=1324776 RepID=UPI002547F93A|nr:uncharacterized protein N7483_001395 [Penicillium malachiteum]KAJ5736270.1 hypothetical protein N7483_001395 [Penicillium malachiteum]